MMSDEHKRFAEFGLILGGNSNRVGQTNCAKFVCFLISLFLQEFRGPIHWDSLELLMTPLESASAVCIRGFSLSCI